MSGLKRLLFVSGLVLILSACSPVLTSPIITATLTPTQQPVSATETLVPAPVATVQLPASDADVPRVSVAEAKAALEAGKAIIVDVRLKAAYEASHIKGALYIGDIEDSQSNLTVPKTQWIITYCT